MTVIELLNKIVVLDATNIASARSLASIPDEIQIVKVTLIDESNGYIACYGFPEVQRILRTLNDFHGNRDRQDLSRRVDLAEMEQLKAKLGILHQYFHTQECTCVNGKECERCKMCNLTRP